MDQLALLFRTSVRERTNPRARRSHRRDIVALALHGEHSVSDLAHRYPMSFAAVQKHVAVLERAGLVSKHRHARGHRVHGEVDTVRTAHRLLDQIEALWRGRFGRIEDLVKSFRTQIAKLIAEPPEAECPILPTTPSRPPHSLRAQHQRTAAVARGSTEGGYRYNSDANRQEDPPWILSRGVFLRSSTEISPST